MLKTKKTLLKRIKISKTGKIMKKQSRTGHLKVKWNASKKYRKRGLDEQTNPGHKNIIKRLLGKHARKIS
jgi:ribosomal protein L35